MIETGHNNDNQDRTTQSTASLGGTSECSAQPYKLIAEIKIYNRIKMIICRLSPF